MSIRSGRYAIYHEKEYRIAKIENHYEIISNDENALNNGFVEYRPEKNLNPRIFFKIITPSEIGDVYEISTFAIYKGVEFYVLNEYDGKYTLSTIDKVFVEKLGFFQYEFGVFHKEVSKEDLDLIFEKKKLIENFFD